jgi:hypothetical protein
MGASMGGWLPALGFRQYVPTGTYWRFAVVCTRVSVGNLCSMFQLEHLKMAKTFAVSR